MDNHVYMQPRHIKYLSMHLSFVQVERPEGTIVDIESRARKLKVLSTQMFPITDTVLTTSICMQVSVNSATTGVYKCFAGGNLVHSFHVTMEHGARL